MCAYFFLQHKARIQRAARTKRAAQRIQRAAAVLCTCLVKMHKNI